jgi:outer membrane protein
MSMVVTVAAVCAAAVLRAQGGAVAVVDLDELYRLHPSTASDNKLLEQTVKDFRAESDELRQKLETLQEDFEKVRKEADDPALSEKARKTAQERVAKTRDALVAANRAAGEKMQSRQEQVNDMRNRMLKKTLGELREVVGKYAEEHKIQVVLPANQTVFSDKAIDITDAILKQMNIQRPPKDKDESAKPVTSLPVERKEAPAAAK